MGAERSDPCAVRALSRARGSGGPRSFAPRQSRGVAGGAGAPAGNPPACRSRRHRGALLGIPLGILAATRPGSWADALATTGALVGISIPPFVLGLALLYFLGYLVPIFPLGGYGTPAHLVLPAITLGLSGGAWYARLLRNTLLDELGNDYVRTARSKGVRERGVLFRHALRNALLPVVTLAGLDLAYLLGGVVLIEAVFGWPGMGQQAYRAIREQNLPMVMGTVLFAAVCVVFINLALDLSYVALDPRIRLRDEK
ncbi:MAG: ABC transporter permease [Anaerolineae bacterium]|nr:ABC transporter permease [Anaerolineae bacterium]